MSGKGDSKPVTFNLRNSRRFKAIKDSREELSDIIKAWAKAKRIEAFFAYVEHRAADMDEDQKAAVLERLAPARTMVNTADVSVL